MTIHEGGFGRAVPSSIVWGQNGIMTTTERETATGVPPALVVIAGWSWRLIAVVGAGYLAAQAFAAVPIVTIPFVLALLLTAVLMPIQRRLSLLIPRPRFISTFLTLIFGLTTFGVVTWFVVTQITTHIGAVGAHFSSFSTEAQRWLQEGPLKLKDADLSRAADGLNSAITTHQATLASHVFETLTTLVEFVAGMLLLVLSTFFLLRDGSSMWHWVLRFVPAANRPRLDHAARAGWRTLGGYMRAVFLIAGIHGVTVTILLVILGVPLAIPLGVLIMLGSFIPLVGLTVTGAICAIVALIDSGPGAGAAVMIGILALMQLEGHFLQPLIMSRNVEIHPLAVAFSALIGASTFGITGALLAVPSVAFIHAAGNALQSPAPAGELVSGQVGEVVDQDLAEELSNVSVTTVTGKHTSGNKTGLASSSHGTNR